MANNQSMYGFRLHSSLQGGPGRFQPLRVRVASGYQASPGGTSVDLWPGDPVKKVNDGTIALCAAGDATWGIIAGFGPQDFLGTTMSAFNQRLPGGTTWSAGNADKEIYAYIWPIAGNMFEVDVSNNTTFTTLAGYEGAIGENCDIVINADATAKKANPRLDITTHATTNTLVWRIEDIARQVNLDVTGTFMKLLVSGNVVQQAPYQTTGV